MGSPNETEAGDGTGNNNNNNNDNTPEIVADKAESTSADLYIDPVKERKMMLKFDICAIGMLGLFYMLANLDRYAYNIQTRLSCMYHAAREP
jgi:hypothetical protein